MWVKICNLNRISKNRRNWVTQLQKEGPFFFLQTFLWCVFVRVPLPPVTVGVIIQFEGLFSCQGSGRTLWLIHSVVPLSLSLLQIPVRSVSIKWNPLCSSKLFPMSLSFQLRVEFFRYLWGLCLKFAPWAKNELRWNKTSREIQAGGRFTDKWGT